MEYTKNLQSLLTKVEEIVTQESAALRRGEDPEAFRSAVARVREVLDAVGRTAFMQLASSREETSQTVEREGTVYRFKQESEKEWMTLWGRVRMPRRLYQADVGGQSVVPLDERCGMIDRFMVPEIERVVAYLGSEVSPSTAEQILGELFPEGVSRTAIQHVHEEVGQCIEQHSAAVEEAIRQEAPLRTDGDILVVSWDGVTVPIRERACKRGRPAERPRVREGASTPTAWKEAGVGLVACYRRGEDAPERVDVRYAARMPEAKMATLRDQLAGQVRQALLQGDFAHRVMLADGSREIWRRVAEELLYADFCLIVDFYHASEHLSQAAEHLFGKGTPAAGAWYTKWRKKLKEDPQGVTHLLRSMRYYLSSLRPGSARYQAARQQIGYFRNNRSKMNYAAYLAQGLPIGSGPVEAACKTLVGQRLKRSGMRWSIAGGQNILNLRVLTQSKRWDVFWKWYLQYTDLPRYQRKAA